MMNDRAFNRADDIPKLQAFLVEMRHRVDQAAYFQLGDLLWRIYYLRNGFDDARDLRLWCDDRGEIAGFVFYHSPDDNPEFFLRPEYYDDPLADAMVAWAVDRARAGGAPAIDTSCIDTDTAKAAFLCRVGFQPVDDTMVFMARPLADPIPEVRLPEGYALLPGAGHPELSSITGNPMTPEAYVHLRRAPAYKPDLAVRACYRGREIAAGCICWYDDLDRCGEFEPVGTAGAHRNQGLATAVLAQTMRNLRRYDADTVYVRTYKDNLPAVGLYRKVGFRITHEDHGWRRSV
jgi:mycothiol synthase